MASLAILGDVVAGIDRQYPYPLLNQASWLLIAVGSGLSLVRKGGLASVGRPGRPRRAGALPLALLAVTVAGVLVTWVQPWIQYTFTGSMGPHSEQLGYAFDTPGVEIAGTVGEIVAMGAAAALWRPARFGPVLLTGGIIYLANLVLTGVSEAIEAPPKSYFGILDHRMTISVAGTPWLRACCGFIAALVVVYEWLLTRSRPRLPQAAAPVISVESVQTVTGPQSPQW